MGQLIYPLTCKKVDRPTRYAMTHVLVDAAGNCLATTADPDKVGLWYQLAQMTQDLVSHGKADIPRHYVGFMEVQSS